MKKYKRDTLLEIYWEDIVSDPTWQDNARAEVAEPAHCRTVGYYTMKRKNALILVHTITDDQRDSIVIPLGCITKVTKL